MRPLLTDIRKHGWAFLLALVAALPGCQGQLDGGRLNDIDDQLDAMEGQLAAGAVEVCVDYLDLCELAIGLCLTADQELADTCSSIVSRCKTNLAKYCPDEQPDAGAADAGVTDAEVTDQSQGGAEQQPIVIEAENGVLVAPFVAVDGAISQPVETNQPAAGGRASYTFNLVQAGDYVIDALVDAPNEGANSFFINVDAEASGDQMIWDVRVTSGFELRTVRWRGNGTYAAPAVDPKIFKLAAGTHELIVRGREANTRLDRLTIKLHTGSAPPPPADGGVGDTQPDSSPPPPPPPPPPGSVVFANDFDDDPVGTYSTANLQADWNSPSWNDGVSDGRVSIVDGTAAFEGKSLKCRYPANTYGYNQWMAKLGKSYNELFCAHRVPGLAWSPARQVCDRNGPGRSNAHNGGHPVAASSLESVDNWCAVTGI